MKTKLHNLLQQTCVCYYNHYLYVERDQDALFFMTEQENNFDDDIQVRCPRLCIHVHMLPEQLAVHRIGITVQIVTTLKIL